MLLFRLMPRLLALVTVFALSAQSLFAQAKDPHIGYVYPAGGQRGTTVEVVVGGQFLDGTTDVLSSGGGLRITVVKINKPLPPKRLNELRDYLEEARKKLLAANTQTASQPVAPTTTQSSTQSNSQPAMVAPPKSPAPPKPIVFGFERISSILKETGATDEEIKMFYEMRQQRNDPKRQQNVQLSETVIVKIEIAADALNGPREIRLLKPSGASNPLPFCVGQLPEQVNVNSVDKPVDPVTHVTLPTVINGQILPGRTDQFSFQATKGMHLVISAQGRDLIPYLADAVPGWFQPALTLYDASGSEVAFADHFYFNTDPVLFYDVPETGNYRLEVKDLLYRGREDFVYRITMGEIRFVKDIFPLGGRANSLVNVTVSGWNLQGTTTTVMPPNVEGIYPITELSNGLVTRSVLFADEPMAQYSEVEPNNDLEHAQRVPLPLVINGRIDAPGDVDVFSFFCRAGDNVVAEVYARRLNSPLDSWLRVTDAAGHQIAFNDDCEDKGSGLLTHVADSYLKFTAPTDGLYYVHLGDAQGAGGPEYAYRLRISAPMPDFALYVTPSAINGRAGFNVPVTIHVVRKDGFSGDISLRIKEAPPGFVLDGGKISAGQDSVRATLAFPQSMTGKPLNLVLEGNATIEGKNVVHTVKPAEDMIQAFFYHHLVPTDDLIAMAPAAQFGRAPIKIVNPPPMKLRAGDSAQIVLSQNGHAPFVVTETRLQLNNPPDGISIASIFPSANGTSISFKTDAAKVKRGLKGNLIVEAFAEKIMPAVDGKPPEKKSWSIGFLPAIPFEIAE